MRAIFLLLIIVQCFGRNIARVIDDIPEYIIDDMPEWEESIDIPEIENEGPEWINLDGWYESIESYKRKHGLKVGDMTNGGT